MLIKCPECNFNVEETDLVTQVNHMLSNHPERVQKRREESSRWDGWEND